jgi:pimeloyl-ACP methyl ester carboxylesterase
MNARDTILDTATGPFAIRDHGGAGRGLLLVHGTGHNLEVWEPLADRLRGDFRVVSFDLRGHGQTPLNSAKAEEHWRDLAAIIDALRLKQPILVGHSGGGYAVAAHAAAGGACAGLVVVDGFVPDPREAALRATGVVPREQLRTMFRYGWVATDEQKEAGCGRRAPRRQAIG